MSSASESAASLSSGRPEMLRPRLRGLPLEIPLGMGTSTMVDPRSVGRRTSIGGGGGARVDEDGGRVALRRVRGLGEVTEGIMRGTGRWSAGGETEGGRARVGGIPEAVKTSSTVFGPSGTSRSSRLGEASDPRRLVYGKSGVGRALSGFEMVEEGEVLEDGEVLSVVMMSRCCTTPRGSRDQLML